MVAPGQTAGEGGLHVFPAEDGTLERDPHLLGDLESEAEIFVRGLEREPGLEVASKQRLWKAHLQIVIAADPAFLEELDD